MDPWFVIRNLLHLQHPRSPLSSDTLVHNAFFGPATPRDKVRVFAQQMPNYESLAWPIGMMKRFTDVRNILRNLQGWRSSLSSRVMVMAGSEDKLMGVQLMRDVAYEYREGIEQLGGEKFLDPTELPQTSLRLNQNVKQDTETAVTMVVVEGAGHHLQNDAQADDAAEAVRKFLEQL